MFAYQLFIVLVCLAVVFFIRNHERRVRARFLKRLGFGLMAVAVGFLGLFIIGETFADPGGWQAAALVAAWLVPLALLVLLAWYRPDLAVVVFGLLSGVVVALSIWFALDPSGWRAFEDRNGPIRTVIGFALAAAVTVLGLKRTRAAGVILLVLGSVPIVISSLGSGFGFASLVVVSSPTFIAGALYVTSASMTGDENGPSEAELGPSGGSTSGGDISRAA